MTSCLAGNRRDIMFVMYKLKQQYPYNASSYDVKLLGETLIEDGVIKQRFSPQQGRRGGWRWCDFTDRTLRYLNHLHKKGLLSCTIKGDKRKRYSFSITDKGIKYVESDIQMLLKI